MAVQELKDLVLLKISGQGNQIDIGGALPPVLDGILDILAATQSITQVIVTVDEGTGTPSAEVSVADGVLTLNFHNLKGEKGEKGEQGEQGNTGSSVDYPFELVNNLTTNDATKALSAAQGVVLDDKIGNIDKKLYLPVYDEIDFSEHYRINLDGTKDANDNYNTTTLMVVEPGDIVVYSGRVTNGYVSVGGYADAQGNGFVALLNGDSTQHDNEALTVPDNVHFLIASAHVTSSTSISLQITRLYPDFIEQNKVEIREVIESLETSKSGIFKNPLRVDANGTISTNASYIGTDYIAVRPGDVIMYDGTSASAAVCVGGYADKEGNGFVALISGGVNYGVSAVVPEGVNFIIACSQLSATTYSVNVKSYDLAEETQSNIIALDALDRFNSGIITQADVMPLGAYIRRDTKAIEVNSNFQLFLVENKGYTRIRAHLYSNTALMAAIVFYSTPNISAEGFMDTCVLFPNTTDARDFDVLVPMGCKLIAIGNRPSGTTATFTISREAIDDQTKGAINPLFGKNVAIIGDSISTIYGKNTPYYTIVESDIGNTIQSWVSYFDIYVDLAGTHLTNKTIGGVTLTDAMIGTLQEFTPIADDIGKTIGDAFNYNKEYTITWSQILCNRLGANLIANASYSGASICSGQEQIYRAMSYAWSPYTIGRCRRRNPDGTYTNPDVVIINRGVNDFSHKQGGTHYAQLDDYDIMANGYPVDDTLPNGDYSFRKGYYLTIANLRAAYPNALIVLCTLNVFKRVIYDRFPTRNGANSLPQFNDAIREIADEMGCGIIELDKDGITFENCYTGGYITDSATEPTHPNSKGHLVMGLKAINDICKNANLLS